MKRIIIIIIIIYLLIPNKKIIIPKESIRLRVLANSNTKHDLELKTKVSKELQTSITKLLKNTNNIVEVREKINNNMSIFNKKITPLLKNEKYNFEINFGLNYFPEKKYKGVLYKAGYYESLKVTLGEGLGDNWWCVLFPPLCLLESEEPDEVEYKFFIKEIINKYFK